MLAAVLLAGGVSAPAFAVEGPAVQTESSTQTETTPAATPKDVAEGKYDVSRLSSGEQNWLKGSLKVTEGNGSDSRNIFNASKYVYTGLKKNGSGRVVKLDEATGTYDAYEKLFGYVRNGSNVQGYQKSYYRNGSRTEFSSDVHDTEVYTFTGTESKNSVAYVFTTLSENEFNKIYGVTSNPSGGTTVKPGDNNSGTTTGGDNKNPGTTTGNKTDNTTPKPGTTTKPGESTGDKTDNNKDNTGKTDSDKTDPLAGFTKDELAELKKLSVYQDSDPEKKNILVDGQYAYLNLKAGEDGIVSHNSVEAKILNLDFNYYKDGKEVKSSEEHDTETLTVKGVESGKEVTYVFTTLDHNPFAASDDDNDSDQSKPSDNTQTAKPASSTQNPTSQNPSASNTADGLASTGSGVAAVAGGMAVLASVGAGLMVSRRRLNA